MKGLEALAALRKKIMGLAGPQAGALITAAVTTEIDNQIRACFAEERDPYGKRWAKRKEPTGTWPLLYKTGEGYSSIRVQSQRGGFGSVRVSHLDYMGFHLTGTRNMVPRRFVPVNGILGPIWRPALQRAAIDAIREALADG